MSSAGGVSPYQTKKGRRWRLYLDLPTAPGADRDRLTRGGFLTRKAALEALETLRADYYRLDRAPSSTPLGQFLDEWIGLRESVQEIRPATAEHYADAAARLDDVTRRIPLAELRARDLDRLYSHLTRSGGSRGQGLSARSVRATHALIRKALADAVRKQLVISNVADAATPPSTRSAAPKERKVWSLEEGRAFLNWDGLSVERRALAAAAMLVGLRRSEIAGLRWTDLNEDDDVLEVERGVSIGRDRTLHEGAPKTVRGRRRVNLGGVALDALTAYRRAQRETLLAVGHRPENSPLFLRPSDLKPAHPDDLTRWWSSSVKAAVVAGVVPHKMTLHDGRHWYGTSLVGAGVDPRTLSELLGHSDPAFTLRTYVHSDDEKRRRAASLLDEALGS